jgi:hypothetical protein
LGDAIQKDGKTTAALTTLYVSKQARDAALKSGMTSGVEISFVRLDAYLARL